jgi:hypothetical protein
VIKPLLAALLALCASARAQAPNSLTACETLDGFRLLFDGTIESFRQNWVNYKQGADDNTDIDPKWTLCPDIQAVCTKAQASATLRSAVKYGDFDFRLEYRDDGDAGIFYRGLTRAATINMTSVEYGLMNDPTGLAKEEWTGAANSIIAPNPYTYMPFSTSQWNSVRIVVIGDSVEHWMNGAKILGYRFWGAAWNAGYAKGKWATSKEKAQATPGCKCPILSGYFGFQGDHATTWNLRSIRVNTDARTLHFGPVSPSPCGVGTDGRAVPFSRARPEYQGGALRLAGATGPAEVFSPAGALESRIVFSGGEARVPALEPGLHFLRRGRGEAASALKFLAP